MIGKSLFALAFAVLVAACLLWPMSRGGRPVDTSPSVAQAQAPAKVGPQVKASEPGAKSKVLTLAEAVVLAESHTKGYAVKAERKDRPDLTFKVDVMTFDGQRRRVDVGGDGVVRVEKTEEKKVEERRDDRKEKRGRDGSERPAP